MVGNHPIWGILTPGNMVMNLLEKRTQNSHTEMFLFPKAFLFQGILGKQFGILVENISTLFILIKSDIFEISNVLSGYDY